MQESSTVQKAKSASAFRTIGEVSAELAVPPHVLRFWESKFNQIKPHKRRGGHRYYRPVDIDTIKQIKTLLYEKGFTIKGAQKYLRDLKKLEPQEQPPDGQTDLVEVIESMSSDGNNGKLAGMDEISLKELLSELKEVKSLLEVNS